MKNSIKIITLTLLVGISIGLSQSTQRKIRTDEQRIEMAKKNYQMGLHSDNEGIVSSAVKMIAKMKMRYPTSDLDDIKEDLRELSVEHPSAPIRYKAYLAYAICEDPLWFSKDQDVVTRDERDFFIATSHRLQQKLFGYNGL